MCSEICHVAYPLLLWTTAYYRNNGAAGLMKLTALRYARIYDVMIFSRLHQPNMKINYTVGAAFQLKSV